MHERHDGPGTFFAFALELSGGRVSLEIAVPPERVDVLDAVAARAAVVGRGDRA